MRIQGTEFLQFAADATGADPSLPNPRVPMDGTTSKTATFYSSAFFVGRSKGFTLVFTTPSTGAPVASVKIQASVDGSQASGDQPDANITTWYDLALVNPSTGVVVTSQSVNGATTCVFEETDSMYRWIRLVCTYTSGTVTPTCKVQYKGIG